MVNGICCGTKCCLLPWLKHMRPIPRLRSRKLCGGTKYKRNRKWVLVVTHIKQTCFTKHKIEKCLPWLIWFMNSVWDFITFRIQSDKLFLRLIKAISMKRQDCIHMQITVYVNFLSVMIKSLLLPHLWPNFGVESKYIIFF